jgi:hypothetical protein
VIPTAILGGLLLGPLLRWWAIPLIAFAWAAVIAITVDISSVGVAALLGAANAAVGVLIALPLRKLLDRVAALPGRRVSEQPTVKS